MIARGGRTLSAQEIERYSRQLLLRELGEAGQLRLRQARATLVGCGGLGVAAALYLGAAGVGSLRLVDFDVVALDNLNRQVAYATPDVGHPKAEVLAARVLSLNPTISVAHVRERVDSDNAAQVLADADLVLECSDDPELKFLINDRCAAAGLALVVGGAVGFQGQVVAVPEGAPCYRCLFGSPPAGATENCRAAGVVGPLVGVIGALQALEGLRLLAGLDQGLGGRLLDFDGLRGHWREVRFPRDPRCPAHEMAAAPR
ncbi:MAG: HesA/MoeB/ThiF family protein [Candidatus Dormibacteria bacterium]